MRAPKELIDKLKDQAVVIWGARMTGLGFARYLAGQKLPKPIAFVDSDNALHGKHINSVIIVGPDEIQNLKDKNPNLKIVIAVSIKEDEIVKNLRRLGFSDNDFLIYSDFTSNFYTIDILGTCNLSCPSCPHGASELDAPKGSMSYETFCKVVDKALSETKLVSHMSLYSWGEPLVHPHLDKMIRYLHDHGIAVAISSNLSIHQEKLIEKMIKENPDYLKISTSGYYPSAYDSTHTGGDVNLVKSNLYKVRYLIDKHKASTLVDVNYHLYRNNSGKNLEKMKELCAELGFSLSTSYALVMPLERVINHYKGEINPELDKLRENLLVDIKEGVEASKGVETEGCPFRDNQININWDLSVPLCCTVFERNEKTLLTDNFIEISLAALNEKKSSATYCAECMRLGLPEYNMGYNQNRWKEIASNKTVTDIGYD